MSENMLPLQVNNISDSINTSLKVVVNSDGLLSQKQGIGVVKKIVTMVFFVTLILVITRWLQ
jgi:hypothetical protein